MAGKGRFLAVQAYAAEDEQAVWSWHGGYEEKGTFSGRPVYQRDTSDNGEALFIYYHPGVDPPAWFISDAVPESESGPFQFEVSSKSDASSPQEAAWDPKQVQAVVVKDGGADQSKSDLFVDQEFPHCSSSINRPGSQKGPVRLMHGEPQWVPGRRLRDGEWHLFKHVDPLDVLQGEVGDCWLVSAIAAMADFPTEIRKIFLRDGFEQKDGKYVIRVFDYVQGKELDVTVDEYFPCCPKQWWELKTTTYFCHPHHNELWSMLLEKAMAKVFGSYGELNGGTCSAAWRALTGEREQIMWTRDEGKAEWTKMRLRDDSPAEFEGSGETMTAEKLFDHLRDCDAKSYMMAAAIKGDVEHHREDGLVEGHCYTLAHMKDVRLGEVREHKHLRLVDLRNPWGNDQEWTGAWSDHSTDWTEHPEVAEQLRPTFADDGVFWMSFDDFSSIFTAVYICPRPMRHGDDAAEHAERVEDWTSLKVMRQRTMAPRRKRRSVAPRKTVQLPQQSFREGEPEDPGDDDGSDDSMAASSSLLRRQGQQRFSQHQGSGRCTDRCTDGGCVAQ